MHSHASTLHAQADALDAQATALHAQATALRQLANSSPARPTPSDEYLNSHKLAQHFGVGCGTMHTLLANARSMGAITWLTIPGTKSRIYKVSDVQKLLNN